MRGLRAALLLAAALAAGAAGLRAQEAAPAAGQETLGPAGTAGQGATMPGPDPGKPVAGAGSANTMTIPSPVLTIDPERLFTGTKYGQRIEAQLADAGRALAAENRKIEADLSAEEKALTEKRAGTPPEEFRKLADAFDAKVVAIRKAQDAKAKALTDRRETERQKFLQQVLPILADLVRENGAVAILNRQAIFLSFSGIDVTDRAIARIDEKIGDGSAAPAPAAPDATPPAVPAPAGN